jgi:fructose PTS system EIIBC or EIIC component
VIPPLMVASATAASLSLAFGATLQAPHGGIFVIGLIGNWPMYLVAIAVGTVVGALLLAVTKSLGQEKAAQESPSGETASTEATASA